MEFIHIPLLRIIKHIVFHFFNTPENDVFESDWDKCRNPA